jgi:hypothetical protein
MLWALLSQFFTLLRSCVKFGQPQALLWLQAAALGFCVLARTALACVLPAVSLPLSPLLTSVGFSFLREKIGGERVNLALSSPPLPLSRSPPLQNSFSEKPAPRTLLPFPQVLPAPTACRWQHRQPQCYYIKERRTLDFSVSVFPDKTGSPLSLPRLCCLVGNH